MSIVVQISFDNKGHLISHSYYSNKILSIHIYSISPISHFTLYFFKQLTLLNNCLFNLFNLFFLQISNYFTSSKLLS